MRDAGLRDRHPAELQVGALVIFSVLVLVVGILWVSGVSFGGTAVRLHAVAPDAGRATQGDPILYRGVQVGTVQRVRIQPGNVVLDLSVRGVDSLPADTRVVIQPGSFLGRSSIQLVPGEATETLSNGDTVQASPDPGMMSVASNLGNEASQVLGQTRALLSDETVRNVGRSTESMAQSMERLETMLEEERGSVTRLVQNLDSLSSRLRRTASSAEAKRVASRMDSLSRQLTAASSDLRRSSESLSSVMAKVDSGEGTLGKLVNDDRLYEDARNALQNLQRASEEIAALSADIRRHPRQYIHVSLF